jgi:hypothetical protein
MSSLTHALSQTENFHGMTTNFGLDSAAGTEALVSLLIKIFSDVELTTIRGMKIGKR